MDLYSVIVVITVALLAVTIIDICTNRVIDKKMKKYSVLVCILIAMATLCEWAGIKTNGAAPSLITLHRFVKLLEFCLAPLICTAAALSYTKIRYPRFVTLVTSAHIIFQVLSLRYGLVINVDNANLYHRGKLYPIYIAVFSLSIIYCFIALMRDEIEHYTRPMLMLLATLCFIGFGIGIQMIHYELRVDYICIAIGNYFLYNHRCRMILQLDGLTYLFNRRCYEKDIERIGSPTMVISMDLNRFKHINDTYGHATGDFYLKATADILRATFGKYGYCYRYGGDEFFVLLTKKIGQTEVLCRKFQDEIRIRQTKDDIFPDISIGYALYDGKTGHIQKAIEAADEMMYNIKKKHKNG